MKETNRKKEERVENTTELTRVVVIALEIHDGQCDGQPHCSGQEHTQEEHPAETAGPESGGDRNKALNAVKDNPNQLP